MTTRTLDSFDFPKIGVSIFSKTGNVGAMYTLSMTDSASDKSGAAKRIGMGWGQYLGFGWIFF